MRDHERNVCQGGQSWVEAIESKRLSHGQALWVLTQLGFSAGVSAGTFNYYIKSLRKFKSFAAGKRASVPAGSHNIHLII